MVKKETWYVLAAFAVLLALALLFQRQQGEDLATEPLPTERPVILAVDVTQITGLRIEDSTGAHMELALAADGQWEYLEPPAPPARVDQFTVLSGIGTLGRLTEQSSLSPLNDLASVGLDAPAYTITISLVDGTQLTLYVGDKTFNGGAYYVRLPDGNPQLANLFSIDATLDLLRTPPIAPAAATETSAPTETSAATEPVEPTETIEAGAATETAEPAETIEATATP
ncbi:MAG: DUF4340 domain-containing protein [Chloroflexi bacterium]|nr:DUF4340 domain-containing protein [Chloroflexota bacterium]